MPTVAVVCEYNPFHNGHKYQIDQIREQFGEDTRIIAIMSGNYTQRGEIAICDKSIRAKCAVLSGVDLVLELPFPFSMSSAEFFAGAAVHIANSLGVVDYLSFGSESGDIEELEHIATIMMSEEYEKTLRQLIEAKNSAVGYPSLCELTLKTVAGNECNTPMTPNNILGIEYIKALKREKSRIVPHTIRRMGAAYDDESIVDGKLQSATAIRSAVSLGDISALAYIPEITKSVILDELKTGNFPTNESALDAAVISHFRLNPPDGKVDIHDAAGGLYNRLLAKSYEANNIEGLVRLTETKKYTTARIRRAMWYSVFGVTSSELRELPDYTQLLAMNTNGQAELKKIKERSDFKILTKPSRTNDLSEVALRQKLRSDRADSLFQLAKPCPASGNYALTFTPYVRRDD